MSVITTAVSSGIWEWIDLRGQTEPSSFTFFAPGLAVAEAATWSLIYGGLALAAYPLAILTWSYLFGFSEWKSQLRKAIVAVFALSMLTDPCSDFVGYLANKSESIFADLTAFAAYLTIMIAFGAQYFSEAVSIGTVKSLLFTSAYYAMFTIGVVGITLALYLISIFYFGNGSTLTTGALL